MNETQNQLSKMTKSSINRENRNMTFLILRTLKEIDVPSQSKLTK